MNVSDARSRGSKPTVDAEDSLVLNSDREIVGQRDRVVDQKASREAQSNAQKTYYSTKSTDN